MISNELLAQLHRERVARSRPKRHTLELPHGSGGRPGSTTVSWFTHPGISIGSHLWPGAVAHALHVLSGRKDMENKVVLEIGAGCGMLGLIIAAVTDASQVILTDIGDDLVGPEGLLTIGSAQATCQRQVVARELDWNACSGATVTPHDVLVASDVIYDPMLYSSLLDTLLTLTAANPQSITQIAYQVRNADEQIFFESASQHFHIVCVAEYTYSRSSWANCKTADDFFGCFCRVKQGAGSNTRRDDSDEQLHVPQWHECLGHTSAARLSDKVTVHILRFTPLS